MMLALHGTIFIGMPHSVEATLILIKSYKNIEISNDRLLGGGAGYAGLIRGIGRSIGAAGRGSNREAPPWGAHRQSLRVLASASPSAVHAFTD